MIQESRLLKGPCKSSMRLVLNGGQESLAWRFFVHSYSNFAHKINVIVKIVLIAETHS